MYKLLLGIFCAASGVLSSSISTLCKFHDTACLEKTLNDMRPIFFAASPEDGIESSDPVFIKEIIGDLSAFKFKLSNTTIVGFSNCVISNLKINEDLTKAQCDLNCPKIVMDGTYDMSGQLLGIPAEGHGHFTFVTGKYFANVAVELKKVDVDGKTHVTIKNFKLKMEPQEPIKFKMTNLFNGQKDLEDAFVNFANENSMLIAGVVQEPIWYAAMKPTFGNFNKYLKKIAFEDIVSS